MVQRICGRNISIAQACMMELLAPPWDTVNLGLNNYDVVINFCSTGPHY